MKLEAFFEKFDQFAGAPNAVEKLRQIILQLAVRGTLVNQDPTDEPATSLLQKLKEFKSANPLDGRSGRSKVTQIDAPSEIHDLPTNWTQTTIGEILYVIRGSSPRPKGDPLYFSETRTPYHWVKISDIRKHGRNGLLMDTDEFLTEAGMQKSVLLPKGTLVLTNSATIGVPIVLGVEGCCIHDGYLAFPNFPKALLSQKYFVSLLHTLKEHAEQSARGLAQLNLNTELVRSFPFGLPPLAEQKRIVAKVDELMALCDRLEAQQQERETRHAALARASLARFADAPTPVNLDFLFHKSYAIDPADLRKSILTLAVQGKLVHQDPDDEPASELVTRIAPQCAAGTAEGRESIERPFEVPDTWRWVKLGDLIESMSNGIYKPAKFFSETGTACVRMFNIQDGRLELTKLKRLDLTLSEVEQYRLEIGDLLVNRVNSRELVGKCAVVATSDEPLVFEAMNIRVRLVERQDLPNYVNLVLRTDRIRELFQDSSKQAIGQASINQPQVAGIAIPIPPLAEQRRIVAKVDQLMALVDQLETQLAASRATAEKLLEALVAELTAPDRSTSLPPQPSTNHKADRKRLVTIGDKP